MYGVKWIKNIEEPIPSIYTQAWVKTSTYQKHDKPENNTILYIRQ